MCEGFYKELIHWIRTEVQMCEGTRIVTMHDVKLPDSEKGIRGPSAGLLRLFMTGLVDAVLCIFVESYARAAVVTLQEGVHGYSGCKDSYIFYYGHAPYASANYGASTNLRLNSQHFYPG